MYPYTRIILVIFYNSIHCERGVAEIENFAEIFHIAFEVPGGAGILQESSPT